MKTTSNSDRWTVKFDDQTERIKIKQQSNTQSGDTIFRLVTPISISQRSHLFTPIKIKKGLA